MSGRWEAAGGKGSGEGRWPRQATRSTQGNTNGTGRSIGNAVMVGSEKGRVGDERRMEVKKAAPAPPAPWAAAVLTTKHLMGVPNDTKHAVGGAQAGSGLAANAWPDIGGGTSRGNAKLPALATAANRSVSNRTAYSEHSGKQEVELEHGGGMVGGGGGGGKQTFSWSAVAQGRAGVLNIPAEERKKPRTGKKKAVASPDKGGTGGGGGGNGGGGLTVFDIIESQLSGGKKRVPSVMYDATAASRVWDGRGAKQKAGKKAKQKQAVADQCTGVEIKYRGKERQAPKKKKKPTKLKRAILNERYAVHQAGKEAEEEKSEEKAEVSKLSEASTVTTVSVETKAEANGGDERETEDEKGDRESTGLVPLAELACLPAVPSKTAMREYCNHIVTPELRRHLAHLLSELVRFEARMRSRAPLQAAAKRRFVCGLREAVKFAKQGKVRSCLLAYNLEQIKAPGGLDGVVGELLAYCQQQEIPVICALTRSKMARLLKKKGNISVVAILNYDGVNETHKEIVRLVEEGRKEQQQIDRWLATSCLNRYGDAAGTEYAKDPLMPGNTKEPLDIHQYLVAKFPAKPWAEETGDSSKP